MAIGFRDTPADRELIEHLRRGDESTTEVIRRALRALDTVQWHEQAQADAERIDASGEDLNAEADAW